jgi:type IV secretion system protein VirD4
MFQRQSETNSEQKRALMLPQEIQKLPASEAILIRPGMFPIRCDRIEYFNDATFKNLELRPPDIEPITIEIRLDRGHGSLEKPVVKPQAPAPGTPALAGIKADVEDSETGKEGFGDPTSPAVPQRRTTPKAKRAKSKAKGKAKDKAAASDAQSEEGGKIVELRRGTSHPAPVPSPPQEVDVENLFPLMTPEQADGLMVKIAGVVPSFRGLGMQDSKTLIATLISRIPTVENRASEHESSGIEQQLRLGC